MTMNRRPQNAIGGNAAQRLEDSADIEYFRSLFTDFPEAIFLKDGQGCWQVINRAAMRLFDLDDTKPWRGLTDRQLGDLYPVLKVSFEVCAASDERTWHARRETHGVERVVDATGDVHLLAVRKIPYFHPDGARKSLVVIAKEIKSPAGPRERLLQRQEELETILDATSTAIWYKDKAHKFLQINMAACTLIGRDKHEIVDHLDAEIFPDHIEEHREAEREVMVSQRSVWNRVEKLILPTGHTIDVEVDRVPYWRGSSVVGVIVFVRDITERLRIETALRASEERYRTILAEIKDGYFEVDLEGNLTFFNRTTVDILGYPEEELFGMNNRQYTDPETARAVYRVFNQVYRTGIPLSTEYQVIRKDETPRYVDVSISLMQDEQNRPTGFRGIVRDITERKESEVRLHFLAHHDVLTSLPNRSLVMDRLTGALASAQQQQLRLAVLFLDLDRFKNVNDTLGHVVGDQLLRGVAQRLQAALRDKDMVARMGGDEFLILLSSVSRREEVSEVARRILHQLQAPWVLEGEEFRCPGSIGIALFPDHGEDAGTLLKHADIAMYQAKDAGGNTHVLYQSGMNLQTNEYVLLDSQLHQALERHEFVLHYQPQLDARTGRIRGLEALVRWNRPEWGLVPPRDFIGFAEDSGLIIPIGEHVLCEACRQVKTWQDSGHLMTKVAVNLSARQFQQPNIVDLIARVLRDTDLPADRLEIEITETVAMQKVPYTMHVLLALRALGLSVVLDDFGTGFSSLSYLKDFPITALKIDQSFVRDMLHDPKDCAIIKTVIELAENFGLQTIAEGVESQEQVTRLCELGCCIMQGNYFSHPLSPEGWIEQFGASN